MSFTVILLVAALLGTIWLFLYGLKKVLDAEAYQALTNKIVALICKAEIDITGFKKGEKRLEKVCELASQILSASEQQLVNKKGGLKKVVNGIFKVVKVVLPFVAAKKVI